MKICFVCGETLDSVFWQCPKCHKFPEIMDGYLSFSPKLANSNNGFKSEYFLALANLEEKNFWFRSRNRLIIWSITRYFPKANHFFEIGCGTGYVLSGLKQAFPHMKLFGCELSSAGLKYAANRIKDATFFQMDARNIPFDNEFNIIGAFDVLEHIEEDELVLNQMYKALHTKGGMIITVPQHQFLWSLQDEHACHVRRYSLKELKNKVEKAGFKIMKTTSFVSLLLPLMYLSRFRKQKSKILHYDVLAELKLPNYVNFLFEQYLDFERSLIRLGVKFPIGGSLLLVAQKN